MVCPTWAAMNSAWVIKVPVAGFLAAAAASMARVTSKKRLMEAGPRTGSAWSSQERMTGEEACDGVGEQKRYVGAWRGVEEPCTKVLSVNGREYAAEYAF